MATQGRPLDPSTRKTIDRLLKSGLSMREIARNAGVSNSTLHRHVKQNPPSSQSQ